MTCALPSQVELPLLHAPTPAGQRGGSVLKWTWRQRGVRALATTTVQHEMSEMRMARGASQSARLSCGVSPPVTPRWSA
jgi:hypothetical protein